MIALSDTLWTKIWPRIWACGVILGRTAPGAWERTIQSGKGTIANNPPPHPLAYFRMDPCSRPETDQLEPWFSCVPVPQSKEEAERRTKTTTDLLEVGEIAGFRVYDLWYTRHYWGQYDVGWDARSVLVQTGVDEYRELQATELSGTVGKPTAPSEILSQGAQPFLVVVYHDGGNNAFFYKTPYIFGPDGPRKVDLSPVENAIAALTPPNMGLRISVDDYTKMTSTVELYRNDTNGPPVSVNERGRITVTFRFVDGRAVVTSSKYEPYLLH